MSIPSSVVVQHQGYLDRLVIANDLTKLSRVILCEY
jgi:hypothetical protein